MKWGIYNDGLTRQNPDDTEPIVRRPMGLPITAGCNTGRIRTRDCSDASCTEMQCLRPLRPCVNYLTVLECLKFKIGGYWYRFFGKENIGYQYRQKI